MLKMFRNYDDIIEMYGNQNRRNLSDRLHKLYDIHRQPRPHIQLSVYVNRRCQLIQKQKTQEFISDYVMDTKRKKVYGAYENILPWRS